MKTFNNFIVKVSYAGNSPIFHSLILLFLFFSSCTNRRDPYFIVEFTGAEEISNYSKSFLLTLSKPDSAKRTIIMCGEEDLLVSGDFIFLVKSGKTENRYHLRSDKNVWYVDDKLYSIYIPDNDDMIPWFENMKGLDLSELHFINFEAQISESYLPHLAELAKIKPDAGLIYSGDFNDMGELLNMFNPWIIAGPMLVQSDFDRLKKLNKLEILLIKPDEHLFKLPLPSLPELEHLYLTELDEKTELSDQFLINNKQIERLNIEKTGNLDLSILKPLKNLTELVVSGADTIFNMNVINDLKKLEVLSLTGSTMTYDPALIKLPSLRWVALSSEVKQEEFDAFVPNHPDLEMVELVRNEEIKSLQALSGLSKLAGLSVTDTVTDIASIRTLSNLKYLSLPADFLDAGTNMAEIREALPDTRVVGNEGFCLGSGWLLLIIPLVVGIRLFDRRRGFDIK